MTTDVQLRTQTPLPSLLIAAQAARTHAHTRQRTRARRAYTQAYFFYANGGERELRTKDADLMVAMCSQILQSRDRLL